MQQNNDKKGNYRSLKLRKALIDRAERYIEEHPEEGYSSIADFVGEAVRKHIRERESASTSHTDPESTR